VAVSFIGGGNQSTRRKPPTCRKSLTNYKTFTQQDKICAKSDISSEAIDGEVKEKEDNISKLVDRLSQQLLDEQRKKES
jgi:hypothetical protein